ncbi:hypothetical protein BS78_10G090200 [Paspalum vaginatum]|nr:hypothetical protein BS78_10G090200 [Paspalum vaginatum]
MALLEGVVFPQDHQRLRPCCRTCGASSVLCGYGIGIGAAGEVEEGVVTRGVVVQEDGDEGLVAVAAPPHGGACCAWAGAAVTSWAGGPAPSTLATSSARRPAHQAAARRLRRRSKGGGVAAMAAGARSSVVEAESHRLNHIAVERNRRRLVNAYLAALRGLMPPSYARRGDQASIVGGAITFIKELEHHLQSLQAQRRPGAAAGGGHGSERFPGFFTFPQYSTAAAASSIVDDAGSSGGGGASGPTARPGAADVEAAVSEGHATVKVFAPRRPGQQLLRLLLGLQSRGLAAHHLNVTTTADHMVLYTVSLRMGDGCELSSANDVAAAVHSIAVAGMDAAEERAII